MEEAERDVYENEGVRAVRAESCLLCRSKGETLMKCAGLAGK